MNPTQGNPRLGRARFSLAPIRTPRDPTNNTISTPTFTPLNRAPLSAARLSASARRPTATTPHGRAARRALDQRRAAVLTPGRRRRSLREQQRETPRDLLRDLSRVLAPASQAVASSSSPDGPDNDHTRLSGLREESGNDDDDDDDGDEEEDDFPIERPRFSLPMGGDDDEDDDSELRQPQLSMLEDEDFTAKSIELPRRMWTEGMQANAVSPGSIRSIRFSDYIGPEVQSDDGVGMESGFYPGPAAFEDDSDDAGAGGIVLGDPEMVERDEREATRRQTTGRDSLFGPIDIPDAGDESPFVMQTVESPVRDLSVALEEEEEDQQQQDIPLNDDAPLALDSDDDPPPGPDWFDYDNDNDDNDNDDNNNNDNNTTEVTTAALFNGDNMANDTTILSRTADLTTASIKRPRSKKPGKKISRHGIEYPELPRGVVKKLVATFAKTAGLGKATIRPDTLDAVMQASDWFFEQVSDDLQAYAKHAGRKTIDETDMITLMRRQRQTNASTSHFALAQRYLPRELLQELRMPTPAPVKKSHSQKPRHADDGEDGT